MRAGREYSNQRLQLMSLRHIFILFLCCPVVGYCAESKANDAEITKLGLPRLTSTNRPGQPSRLPKSKVTIADLSLQAGTSSHPTTTHNTNYLVIDPETEWRHSLRGDNGATFVSFQAYASVGTRIEVAGASLTIVESEARGMAEVVCGSSASDSAKFGAIRIERHRDRMLAALPVLTLRIDRDSGAWDLFAFKQIVATGIAVGSAEKPKSGEFRLTAGSGGVWLLGWVNADENPLCEDMNHNGIDDDFERRSRSTLLPANASVEERAKLAHLWIEHQRAAMPAPWSVRRPLPGSSP